MDWKLHVIFSMIIYFLILSIFDFSFTSGLAGLIILVFSSLLPDLDYPKSVIRSIVFFSVFMLASLFVLFYLQTELAVKIFTVIIISTLILYGYKKLPLRHRGRKSLHQWRLCFLLSGISFLVFLFIETNVFLSLFVLLGYGSHLLADRIRKF